MDEYTDASPQNDKKRSARAWLDDIQQAEQSMADWTKRAKNIERIYLDDREEKTDTQRKYAMLWANVSVLQPAVYAQPPQPAVSRRFSDRDPVARAVAEVLERSITSLYDLSDIDSPIKSARDNYLIVGRGTMWVRYVPTFETEQYEGDEGTELVEVLADETLAYDFVHWSDFIHPKARRWEDLPWVGRKVYLDKEAGEKRFGKEVWDKVRAAYMATKTGEYAKAAPDDKPCVFEVWSRRDNEVIWLAENYGEDVLDRRPPLYMLKGFFPCPKPLYATLPTDKLKPVPDYVYYQDQAQEINKLTAKIDALEDALKLVGFYPAGADGEISSAIEMALKPSTSNQMVPVPGWASFVSGGGAKQMIEWLPVENVLVVLQGCIELRQKLIEDVYQITGISDIIRGSTDPRETRGAQQLKAQWGGTRIRPRQEEVARFCRDLTRISAEILSEKFQPDTLWRLSGLKYPTAEEKAAAEKQIQQFEQMGQMMAQQAQATGQQPPPMPPIPEEIEEMLKKPSQEEIIDLMRDDQLRSYRIGIETDSTIAADEQAEKESRQEFVTVLGGLMGQAIPTAMQVPELVPVIGESLLFMARAYRAGRSMEDVIETAVENLTKKADSAGNQPPQPDPRVEKIKADAKLQEQKLAAQVKNDEAKTQIDAQEAMSKEQREWAEFQSRDKLAWAEFQADQERVRAEMMLKQQSANQTWVG